METDETASEVLTELKAWKVLVCMGIPLASGGAAILELVKTKNLDVDLRTTTLLHYLLQASSDLISSPYHRKKMTREAYASWIVDNEEEGASEIKGVLDEWRKRTEGKEKVETDEVIEAVVLGLT